MSFSRRSKAPADERDTSTHLHAELLLSLDAAAHHDALLLLHLPALDVLEAQLEQQAGQQCLELRDGCAAV